MENINFDYELEKHYHPENMDLRNDDIDNNDNLNYDIEYIDYE